MNFRIDTDDQEIPAEVAKMTCAAVTSVLNSPSLWGQLAEITVSKVHIDDLYLDDRSGDEARASHYGHPVEGDPTHIWMVHCEGYFVHPQRHVLLF